MKEDENGNKEDEFLRERETDGDYGLLITKNKQNGSEQCLRWGGEKEYNKDRYDFCFFKLTVKKKRENKLIIDTEYKNRLLEGGVSVANTERMRIKLRGERGRIWVWHIGVVNATLNDGIVPHLTNSFVASFSTNRALSGTNMIRREE